MKKINWSPLVMASIIVVGMLVGMSFLISPSAAEAGASDDQTSSKPSTVATISMTGTAQGSFAPDLGVVYLKIETRDMLAETAKDKNAKIADDVMKALLALGIDEEDIETQNYQICPEYEWTYGSQRKRVFKGYVVTNTMKVSTKDFDKMGKIIDASVDNGALIDRINFELSNEKFNEYKTLVLAEAAVDTKNKAEAVISALGADLGDIVSVSGNSRYTPRTYYKSNILEYDAEAVQDVPTNIQPKDLDISASISVVFEIIQ